MFKIAQQIVRHKVGVVAVVAFAVFMFSDGEAEEEQKSSSPWSSQQVAVADKKDQSFIGAHVDAAVDAAGTYLEESVGVNPVELGEETVGRFDEANDAMTKANKSR
ncbi:MAG: hypothetical protein KDE55_24615 [Novosphingobium sp.]|nr:hypothetical protein [Novosphingobium sp.]